MRGQFEGRIAFVTGAAQGIGAGVARRLAREGAAVAAVDIDRSGAERTAKSIEADGGRAFARALDVRSPEEIERAVAATEVALGTPTLAVTCAGIIRLTSYLDLPEENWDATLDINLKGTFFTFQRVARHMVAANLGGSLVAISSVAGRGGRVDGSDYAASKAGVISVVRSTALSLARHGITANAVCPGVVETPMTRGIHERRGPEAGKTPEESLAAIVSTIPLGRIETVDDVANAVVFLLSQEGSYITGQALNVCGGLVFD